jgi:hypothetical protein
MVCPRIYSTDVDVSSCKIVLSSLQPGRHALPAPMPCDPLLVYLRIVYTDLNGLFCKMGRQEGTYDRRPLRAHSFRRHPADAIPERFPMTISTTPTRQTPAAMKKGVWGANVHSSPPIRLAGMTTRPRVK